MSRLSDLLACPRCRDPLREEDGDLRCPCSRYPVVDGIPLLTEWARGRRFTVEEVLARHRPPPRTIIEKVLRRLSPGAGRIRRALARPGATFLRLAPELGRATDLDYFRYRFSDFFYIGTCALMTAARQGPVLDLGCGAGHVQFALSKRLPPGEIVGLDISFTLLYLARRFVAPGRHFVCADGSSRLPFRDGVFETAVCVDAFRYLPDRDLAAGELQRVARGPLLLSHLSDPAFHGRGEQPSLEPSRYLEMFSARQPRLYVDQDILDRFLQTRTLDLTKPGHGLSEAISLVAGVEPRVYAGADYFVGGPNLRLNPVYEALDGRLRRRLLAPRHEAACRAYGELLPFELDRIPDAPTPELVRRFVFIDLPPAYC
jgi:SAM-dependent methyltransferase/uncharacterized protein YbaR (Trm112 family)